MSAEESTEDKAGIYTVHATEEELLAEVEKWLLEFEQ